MNHLSLRSRLCPTKDEAVTRNGVVTATHHQAAEIGLSILKKGWNAVDANSICTIIDSRIPSR